MSDVPIPIFFAFNPKTREPAGIVESISAVPPDVGFYQPPYSCEDAPPDIIPSGKRCMRNNDNTDWIFVDAVDQRRLAYERDADMLLTEAQRYRAESEGLELLGDAAGATNALRKAEEYLKQYAEKKQEIRARFPDDPIDVADSEATNYYLSSSGTYHMAGCSYVSGGSALMDLTDIYLTNPQAKPCSRCTPPELPSVEGESD